MTMLEVKELSKLYYDFKSLNAVSFRIQTAESYALVGPNGSGKTTLINILLGISYATSGSVNINCGRSEIGSSLENEGFFPNLSVLKNLKIFSTLKSVPKFEIHYYLEMFNLSNEEKKKFKELSEGMKKKVSLISAFLGSPKFIILDEPLNNLDFDTRLTIRSLINRKKENKTTFLISSHDLTELEKTCDHISFIKGGKIVESFKLSDMKERYRNLETAYQILLKP